RGAGPAAGRGGGLRAGPGRGRHRGAHPPGARGAARLHHPAALLAVAAQRLRGDRRVPRGAAVSGGGTWNRAAWVRLDNASNIFLAARSEVDPKVFRLSAELDHEVDPQLLQEALESTYERYRLYHAVLRRGVFWYYLQDSDLQAQVVAEGTAPCAPIYQA